MNYGVLIIFRYPDYCSGIGVRCPDGEYCAFGVTHYYPVISRLFVRQPLPVPPTVAIAVCKDSPAQTDNCDNPMQIKIGVDSGRVKKENTL